MSRTKISGEEPTQALSPDTSGELSARGEMLGGRYELLGLLGVGGMGSVYRARDIELDEVVALKMIGKELLSSALILERFRQEVKLARRVTHRNVARMFDIGEHEKLKFLTMELIDGESLAVVLERDPILPVPRLAEIVGAICAGLTAAHEAGVIHRDLKPDNVMIAKDGRVLITDFGIARAMFQSAVHTQGMPVGTPAYMAPEQLEGAQDIDARADIYALGVMMYEMAVGAPPFEGETMFAVAAARLIRPPPNPQERNPSIPDILAKVIVKCMQRRKEDRFDSAHRVTAALDAITIPAQVSAKRAFIPQRSSVSVQPPSSEASDGRKILAVLPFKNVGKEEDAHIAEGISEDILDALSMVKGIRVRSRSGSVHELAAARDTGEIGRILGVDVVVDGSVRRLGDNFRITIRLVSVEGGLQLWAKRIESSVGDLLRVADEAATSIAHALTVERLPSIGETTTDPVAVDLFLRGKQEYHRIWHDANSRAVTLFSEALVRAPNDPRILGGYALALARRYAYEFGAEAAGPQAVAVAERTLVLSPRSSAARMAIAVVKWNDGDVAGAAAEISRALRDGPSNGDAHDYCGRLLLECGRPEEAVERLKMALAIEARLYQGSQELTRGLALLGRWDEVWARVGDPPNDASLLNSYWPMRMRMHCWQRDSVGALACRESILALDFETQSLVLALMDIIAQKSTPDALASVLSEYGNMNAVARRKSYFLQVVVEIWAVVGDREKSLEALKGSARGKLSDLTWLDRCPVLGPIRNDPRFLEIRGEVAARAAGALAALGRGTTEVTPSGSPY